MSSLRTQILYLLPVLVLAIMSFGIVQASAQDGENQEAEQQTQLEKMEAERVRILTNDPLHSKASTGEILDPTESWASKSTENFASSTYVRSVNQWQCSGGYALWATHRSTNVDLATVYEYNYYYENCSYHIYDNGCLPPGISPGETVIGAGSPRVYFNYEVVSYNQFTFGGILWYLVRTNLYYTSTTTYVHFTGSEAC